MAKARWQSSWVLLAGILSLAGCLGPRLSVLRTGPGAGAEPRKADCDMPFLGVAVDRPFDEIAALHVEGGDTLRNGPADFHEVLREKACALGADAVVVTQDYTGAGGIMNATAVKFRARP